MESEAFLMKSKHQFIYPDEENKFMVPNHEKKGDYYVNLCLSELVDELLILKMVEREAFFMKRKH